MIINGKCPHCSNQFEADAEEQTTFCPHCGKEVWLKALKTPPQRAGRPAVSVMTTCADCSHAMSTRAVWCQACGSLQGSMFGLIWKIMGAFWLVNLVVAIIAWIIFEMSHAISF